MPSSSLSNVVGFFVTVLHLYFRQRKEIVKRMLRKRADRGQLVLEEAYYLHPLGE